MGDWGLVGPYPLPGQPSVEPRPTLGGEATGDTEPVHRSGGAGPMKYLRALSDDARWDAFEGALNRRLLRRRTLPPTSVDGGNRG
jgi:hypothetical protein